MTKAEPPQIDAGSRRGKAKSEGVVDSAAGILVWMFCVSVSIAVRLAGNVVPVSTSIASTLVSTVAIVAGIVVPVSTRILSTMPSMVSTLVSILTVSASIAVTPV